VVTVRPDPCVVVAEVVDPEMPMLTLADLGVVREVRQDGDDVTVTITPTYSGCPAIDAMRADLRTRLNEAGYPRVNVRTVLSPPWSTDWISERGLRALAEHGIAPPAKRPSHRSGPVALTLTAAPATVRCPRCAAPVTEELSRFGPTACTALRRCPSCREPFEHMKDI
jgi:ring-1,2-phenylacetyl-CoA epoxidase subunit PaaD